MPVQRNTTQRVGSSPEWNINGDIFELPANAVAGTAESFVDAIKIAASAVGLSFDRTNVVGILVSVANSGNKYCYIRTTRVLGASATGKGIYIGTGQSLYLPFPRSGGVELLYETANMEPISVAVFY